MEEEEQMNSQGHVGDHTLLLGVMQKCPGPCPGGRELSRAPEGGIFTGSISLGSEESRIGQTEKLGSKLGARSHLRKGRACSHASWDTGDISPK